MKKRIGSLKFIGLGFGVFLVIVLTIYFFKVNFSGTKTKAAAVITFPRDHGQHSSFGAEWWYLNLLVRTTESGNNFKDLGYVISFSRIAGVNNLLSSRFDQSSNNFSEKTNSGGKMTVTLKNNKYLNLEYINNSTSLKLTELENKIDKKRMYSLKGKTPEIGSFDLILKERTSGILLWGKSNNECIGKISVFGKDDTFYYSISDLDITGSIIDINGVKKDVKIGKAWFDHQWFNSTPPSDWVGHYWTSFHYTKSKNLYDSGPHQALGVVTQIYKDGPKYTYWVRKGANGESQCGTGVGGNIVINKYGQNNYPSSWKIAFSNNQLRVNVDGSSISNNQVFKPPYGPAFYEPVSFFNGTIDGSKVTGLGFFETHLKK